MRDSTKPCQHTLSDDAVYKEVVVIGNGPSGLVTSFMLAGNVPYLKEIPEDLPIDDMLKARLSNLPVGQNLYETDLLQLAEGLEGRSQNPLPLLMDNLLRPCADLGIQADSLIEWKYDLEKQIDHIVLGRGPPGGAWHGFPGAVRTLSPCAWLTLPPHTAAPLDRLPASALADYYRRYVRATKLKRFFRSGVVVTSVRAASRALAPCCARCPLAASFCVAGFDKAEGRPFRYVCRRVVLACGASDRPNTLEPAVAKYSLHSLADLQMALQTLEPTASPPCVLVVGSGVSAADAVRLSRRAGRPAAQLHRAPAEALARLSPQAYPDYSQVYKMMCAGAEGNYPNYRSQPHHVIVDVTPDDPPTDPRKDPTLRPKRVKLLNLVTNELTEIVVSIIIILIGSKPDLFFLQTNFNLNCIELESDCIKCTEKKKIEDERRQWFLKDHWHYLKSVLGQSIQSCKSRYLNYTEINGNTGKCVLPDCNKRSEKKCTCNNLISKLENGIIKTSVEKNCECSFVLEKICQCPANSGGIGFGIDPKKPVDGRGNPIAIDKSTHEVLNAPKGMYALGPLTADNFVRFIPGGALAIVSHIHKGKTE